MSADEDASTSGQPRQHIAILGLGSNLGSREDFLRAAIERIASTESCRVERVSYVYDTEPLGPPQPRYLNAAVRVVTTLSPAQLLERMQHIERSLGRERHERWAARTIDIDILWMDQPCRSPEIEVPHPRLMERSFALAPLLDVAPELTEQYGPALAQLGGAPSRHPFTPALP